MTQHLSTTGENTDKDIIQHDLVRHSFYKIKSENKLDEFIESFYHNLLLNNPELSYLFVDKKMEDLGKKLKTALVTIIQNRVKLNKLEVLIKPLGCRHIGYGVKPEYYSIFGDTLISTLRDYLKDDWSPEIRRAWFDTYNQIVSLMLQGVEEENSSNKITKLF